MDQRSLLFGCLHGGVWICGFAWQGDDFSVTFCGQLGLVWPPVHLVSVVLQPSLSPSPICERASRVD